DSESADVVAPIDSHALGSSALDIGISFLKSGLALPVNVPKRFLILSLLRPDAAATHRPVALTYAGKRLPMLTYRLTVLAARENATTTMRSRPSSSVARAFTWFSAASLSSTGCTMRGYCEFAIDSRTSVRRPTAV